MQDDTGNFDAPSSAIASDVFVPFLGLASPGPTGYAAAEVQDIGRQEAQHNAELRPRPADAGLIATQSATQTKDQLRPGSHDALQQDQGQQPDVTRSDRRPLPHRGQATQAEPRAVVHQQKPRQLQAALEEDLTELTASNWALQQPSQQDSPGLHNSGLVFVPDPPHHAVSSSTSTDGSGKTSSSRHMGFFQVQRADSTGAHDDSMFRPATAGPVPQSAQTSNSLQGSSMSGLGLNSKREQEPQQQAWLQFQQVPGRVATSAALFRSSSSPEPAIKAFQHLLQATGSDGAGTPTNSSRVPMHSRQAMVPPGPRPARASFDSIESRPIHRPQPQPTWGDLAPAGPVDDAPGLSDDLGPVLSFSGVVSCTSAEARLLLQQQQQPPQAYPDGYAYSPQHQHLQPLQAPAASQQSLQRTASTPPGLLGQQQHRVISRAGSPYASPRAPADMVYEHLLPLDGGYPESELNANTSGTGMLPARCRSPAPRLSPEAAAAAAAAASSVQQAMAAVDEEIAQLQVLQHLQKRRRWLQANARAAVSHATAAAAASIAATQHLRSVASGGVGSSGSNAGSSTSTYSSGTSSGCTTGAGSGWPPVMGWLGDPQQGPRTDRLLQQQQQQQAHSSGTWETAGFSYPVRPFRSGSLSPRAAWVSPLEGPHSPTPNELRVRAAGLARSATCSDLPGSSRPQPAPQAVGPHGTLGNSSLSATGAHHRGFVLGAGGDADVHNDWQELAGDTEQLLQLEQALHLLRQV